MRIVGSPESIPVSLSIEELAASVSRIPPGWLPLDHRVELVCKRWRAAIRPSNDPSVCD
jgi:hypothetical protein